MSKENRKRMYDKLVANDKAGLKPGLDQDDGSLILEFGKPGASTTSSPLAKPAPKKGDK